MKSKFFLKRSVALCAMAFLSFTGFSQYGDLHIETKFDDVYDELYGPIYNIAWSNTHANNSPADMGSLEWDATEIHTNSTQIPALLASMEAQNDLGSTRSGSLEGLLRMYEATCNMKYLWEFMEQATQIYNARADRMGYSTHPYTFFNQVPWHGRILYPMAHFVHLVKTNSTLNAQTIPAAHQSNFKNNTTMGSFANMINADNIQIMDYLLITKGFWKSDEECICKVSSVGQPCTDIQENGERKNIAELNFQAPFGCALIYMYLANPARTDYGVKAVHMARAYLVTGNGILGYNASANAYTWYHDGWQKVRHKIYMVPPYIWSAWEFDKEFKEDAAHGCWDIYFPLLYNKYYSSITGTITGNQYFEDYQLVRFKNTFSELIYEPGYPFNCNVMGNCAGPMSGVTQESDVQMNMKCWIDFYKYDFVANSGSHKVYDILMTHYINHEAGYDIDDAHYGGVNMIGLAGLCQANRQKENILCSWTPPRTLLKLPNSFTLSPNPSTEKVMVISDETFNKVVVSDLMGKQLLVSENTDRFDSSILENGSYIVVVYFKDGTMATETLVVNK